MGYLLNSFVLSKIDDSVAYKADTTKLMEFGLVYGDIIAYRQYFSKGQSDNKLASYHEKAAELKKKIQKAHTGRVDAMNRPISVNRTHQVVIGIKCLENKKYKLKINKSFTKVLDKSFNYDDIHKIACDYYKSGNVETYLGNYEGNNIKNSFINLERYALTFKEKKRPLKMYIFVLSKELCKFRI